MLFNSFSFIIYFLIVTSLYFLLPHRFRWFMLLAASCIFYMYFIPVYILILVGTIIIDYFAGIYLEKTNEPRKKKWLLVASLVANIGVLAFFKYFNFFIDNLNDLGKALNWNYSLSSLGIILPIGLSFHTFQAMSYTIEVYRGNQKAEKHFGIYALYVMYYPQLVAGPIERPQNILPQLHINHRFNAELVSSGLKQILIGFFKKMVIADNLASYVNQVYDSPGGYEPITIFLATLFFAIQIYCDFSGYSDIALGASRIMGIELMQNFRSPYLATSISDFWSRWHISLSTWFRDYLYIPLGGNRVSQPKWLFNVFFVFLISGFWHGANWTFIIWGALHGFYSVSEILLQRAFKISPKSNSEKKSSFIVTLLKRSVVFYLVCFAWIFFRAENVSSGITIAKNYLVAIPDYISRLCHSGYLWLEPLIFKKDISINLPEFMLLGVSLLLLYYANRIDYKANFIKHLDRKKRLTRWLYYQALVLLIFVFGVFHSEQEFIYFQF